MKRILALVLVLTLALSLFALTGCSDKQNTTDENANNGGNVENGGEAGGETGGEGDTATSYSLGLASTSAYDSSSDATADAEGNAQVDTTIAAVLLDNTGKIVDCKIDVAQNKLSVSAEGVITNLEGAAFQSKKELKENYNMAGVSPIGKEWYEQAAAFEAYVIGKTADEVSGIALDDAGKPTDETLTAGCTIKIGDFIEAVTKACAAAVPCAAAEGNTLGLGVTTDPSSSKDATADAEGLVQYDVSYVATVVDADGKITAAAADCVQAKLNFSATGVFSTDLTSGAALQSKQELKEGYNMAGVSPIGKEWYEQADAYEAYVIGKTGDEVNGIALDDAGKPTDETLTAGCTINILELVTSTAKACTDALA